MADTFVMPRGNASPLRQAAVKSQSPGAAANTLTSKGHEHEDASRREITA